MARLFRHSDGRTVILPIDEGLISGPGVRLSNLSVFFRSIGSSPPDGILLFAGALTRHWSELGSVAAIVNVTASTKRATHTHKVLCTDVEAAVAAGADLIAVHVNITSQHEWDMLKTLSTVVRKGETLGVPVLAIMYPRGEGKENNDFQALKKAEPDRYSRLVAHCTRIGMELGADVVKTQYTGSQETFERVVDAARPVPVVIAGGPLCSEADALSVVRGAIAAGARGVSFGRNVFERDDPAYMLQLLHSAVHEKVPHA